MLETATSWPARPLCSDTGAVSASDANALRRIAAVLGLDAHSLAAVLRVSPAELDSWMQTSSPAERAAELADLSLIAETLDRKLKPGAAAEIVRRPAAAYGGEAILDLLRAGRHEQVRETVVNSFDFSTSA